MYTITRKLAMVCLAVVFSVLVYGCGGGSSEPTVETPPPEDGMPMAMPSEAEKLEAERLAELRAVKNDVVINSITVGLRIKPGTYTIPADDDMDLWDATFTCPAGEVPCVVTVEQNYDGTNTVTSIGGAATATVSVRGTSKLDATGPVDMSMVTAGLTEITEGMYPLQPGGNMDAGDVTFSCPVVGVPCTVTVTVTDDVDADDEKTGTTTTTVTFLGGMAMAADSAAGKVKLAVVNDPILITELASGLYHNYGRYLYHPTG